MRQYRTCSDYRFKPQFRENHLVPILLIRQAHDIGFSLRETDELLSLRTDPGADCADVREQATAKLQEVERKIARLEEIRASLKRVIATCPGSGALEACSILEAMSAEKCDPGNDPPMATYRS